MIVNIDQQKIILINSISFFLLVVLQLFFLPSSSPNDGVVNLGAWLFVIALDVIVTCIYVTWFCYAPYYYMPVLLPISILYYLLFSVILVGMYGFLQQMRHCVSVSVLTNLCYSVSVVLASNIRAHLLVQLNERVRRRYTHYMVLSLSAALLFSFALSMFQEIERIWRW